MSGSQDNIDKRRLERGSRNSRYSPSSRASARIVERVEKYLLPILLVLTMLAVGLAAFAVGVALDARDHANRQEQRADLLQLEVESFKNVLHAAKLPTSAHLPGESP